MWLHKFSSLTATLELTTTHAPIHASHQDVRSASDGFDHSVRNPFHNDITVPVYVLLPAFKNKEIIHSKNTNPV